MEAKQGTSFFNFTIGGKHAKKRLIISFSYSLDKDKIMQNPSMKETPYMLEPALVQHYAHESLVKRGTVKFVPNTEGKVLVYFVDDEFRIDTLIHTLDPANEDDRKIATIGLIWSYAHNNQMALRRRAVVVQEHYDYFFRQLSDLRIDTDTLYTQCWEPLPLDQYEEEINHTYITPIEAIHSFLQPYIEEAHEVDADPESAKRFRLRVNLI